MNKMERTIFIKGNKYQPVFDFECGSSDFSPSNILTFERDGYSNYDECFIYEFTDSSGKMKSWVMPEDARNDYWEKYFIAL